MANPEKNSDQTSRPGREGRPGDSGDSKKPTPGSTNDTRVNPDRVGNDTRYAKDEGGDNNDVSDSRPQGATAPAAKQGTSGREGGHSAQARSDGSGSRTHQGANRKP